MNPREEFKKKTNININCELEDYDMVKYIHFLEKQNQEKDKVTEAVENWRKYLLTDSELKVIHDKYKEAIK